MFKNLPFDTTLNRLRTFERYVNSQPRLPLGGPPRENELINWELEAFESAKKKFLEEYKWRRELLEMEYETKLRMKLDDYQNNQATQTDTLDKLYSEIKDVQHDDEGYPFVKTGNPDSDSDSGLSSDSDSDSDNEEIPIPTKTKIVRRKPKN